MTSLASTLEACLDEAFRRLAQGAADRRSAFHTVTLATLGEDGAPEARTLVLRGFEPAGRILRLHTDSRAAKVAELLREPRCAIHLYDAPAKLQLRLGCRATVHADDAVAAAAWEASRDASRRVYAIEPAPGTPVAVPPAAPMDAAAGRGVFRVLLLRVAWLEWLELAATGHRRARFDWNADGAMAATWLVP